MKIPFLGELGCVSHNEDNVGRKLCGLSSFSLTIDRELLFWCVYQTSIEFTDI